MFIREAWSEETFAVELRKAERQVPTVGAVDAAEMCVGVWLWEAVGMLRRGGLGRDADGELLMFFVDVEGGGVGVAIVWGVLTFAGIDGSSRGSC